jgi:membrane protease YdiL (CAAX protease family)
MLLRVSVFYLLTWFFLVLLGGIQQETGLLPPEIGLAQWGPGIAALLMLVIFRKDDFKITFFSKATPVLRYLLAALIPLGAGLIVLLMRAFIPMETTTPPDVYDSLLLVLIWMPLGALGEELGWRGYLHKKLDTRMRGLFSSLLVGVLWMPIHIHFFSEGPVFVFFLTLLLTSYSIVIYALVQDTSFSVILATIFHLSINLTNLLFLDVIYETSFMVVNGIVWAVVAAIFVLAKRELYLGLKE